MSDMAGRRSYAGPENLRFFEPATMAEARLFKDCRISLYFEAGTMEVGDEVRFCPCPYHTDNTALSNSTIHTT